MSCDYFIKSWDSSFMIAIKSMLCCFVIALGIIGVGYVLSNIAFLLIVYIPDKIENWRNKK